VRLFLCPKETIVTDLRIAELEAQVEALKRALDKSEIKAMQAEARTERTLKESQLRAILQKANVSPDKCDDMIPLGLNASFFRLDSTGKLQLLVKNGKPDPEGEPDCDVKAEPRYTAWVNFLRSEKPWFFKDAAEFVKATASEFNPWTADNWNLTRQSEYIAKEGMLKAEKLAEAAKTTVFATHPAQKTER
jgi:hypothetical protein